MLGFVLAQQLCAADQHIPCALQPWRKRFSQLRSLIRELEQQALGQDGTSAAATAAGVDSSDTPPEDTAVMLSIVSCESGQLKIQHRGLTNVHLSAYQIDTELLFTTQPFSGISNSSSRYNTRQGSDDAHSGLGKVAFVQPSVRILLPLPQQQTAAAAVGPTQLSGFITAAACTAEIIMDDLLPDLQSQSVLLEVSGGGVSRTVPR